MHHCAGAGFALVVLLYAAPTGIVAQAETASRPLSGTVWVNLASGVYHCAGSPLFGTTKIGEYMSEAAARGRRHRAAEGRACPAAKGLPVQLRPQTVGEVWVNTESALYHCSDSRLYGLTRRGRFLPESEARGAGYRPAGRRSCR